MAEQTEIEDLRVIARRVETEALAREMLAKRQIPWIDGLTVILLIAFTAWTSYELDWPIYAPVLAMSFFALQFRILIEVAYLRRRVRALVALQLGKFDPQE